MKDLRIRILRHFEKLNSSTSEVIANDWLSKQHDDLGTLRRSLIDLIESDYMRLSSVDTNHVEWLKKNWDTTTTGKQTSDDHDKKSSRRLIEQVGSYGKVADVRLYTTVKGLMFISEYRRFKNHYINLIALAILSFFLGLLAHRINQDGSVNCQSCKRYGHERLQSTLQIDSVKQKN